MNEGKKDAFAPMHFCTLNLISALVYLGQKKGMLYIPLLFGVEKRNFPARKFNKPAAAKGLGQ